MNNYPVLQKSESYHPLFIQMLCENISPATAVFLLNIVEDLHKENLSMTDMGRKNHMSTVGAGRHVHNLENKGYLFRVHYREWGMGEKLVSS